MLIFQGISPARAPAVDRVVTIGNFDGVHLGHQSLIARVMAVGKSQSLRPTVVTFEPHPKAYFTPDQAPGKIQGLRGKALALAQAGVQELRILRFRKSLAQMSAEDFMEVFLHRSLRAKAIVIGDDFRFGAKRRGDVQMLRDAGERFGWAVHAMPTVDVDGERASSSRLRDALAAGDIAGATALMGRPYSLSGHVVHGRKLGRDIGFPTLNIAVQRTLIIRGVFVVSVHGLGDDPIEGVASLGHRPTVEAHGRLLLEVHLFDWQGDAYGKTVNVIFHEKLRNELRFDSMDAMIRQIQLDAQQARHYFAQHVL